MGLEILQAKEFKMQTLFVGLISKCLPMVGYGGIVSLTSIESLLRQPLVALNLKPKAFYRRR
jgi:hypothetical protein